MRVNAWIVFEYNFHLSFFIFYFGFKNNLCIAREIKTLLLFYFGYYNQLGYPTRVTTKNSYIHKLIKSPLNFDDLNADLKVDSP